MRQGGNQSGLRVYGQGRAYAQVIGVTVVMLIVGLAVPLAFGHIPGARGSSLAPAQLNPSFATGATGSAKANGAAGSKPVPGIRSATGVTAPGARTAPGAAGAVPELTSNPSGSAGSVGLTATDQGVTATTIKLGVVLLDIQALQPVGFSQPHFTPQEQQSQYQAFIDQVNRSGGILGRRIVPDYKTYNALDMNGSQSAGAVCVQLGEDDKVFAAIGVLGGNMDACLTEQYGIPAISNTGNIAEVYTKSHNLFVTPFASFERGAANWGDLAARSGLVNGRKIGTVNVDAPQESRPEQALVSALTAAGHPVTYRAHLANDQATDQSEIPVEINKMQAAGVNTVFLATNFVTALQFAQSADKQGFKPQYMVSDLGSLTAEGLVGDMPPSFNGAYAFTQLDPIDAQHAENPENKRCRETFNKATGNHYASGNESGGTYLFCWMVTVFKDGAIATGTDLTRTRLARGFQTLGQPALPYTLPGSFVTGKTDYGDSFRPMQYASSCKCYHYAGGAQRGRY